MSADFFSSYLAGAFGILIGNPLDVLKTRIQASSSPSSPLASAATCLPPRHFPSTLSYFTGATFPILGYGALNALLFTTYNRCLLLLGEQSYSTPSSLAKVWVAGAAGGMATWVVSAPTELVKCKAQVQRDTGDGGGRAGAAAIRGPERSSWKIAADVLKAEGIRGLYCGGAVTSVRDAVGYGFYFWSYELCKQSWPSPSASQRQAQSETALQVLICGGIAGIVTWASVFPLDVIKTRVQTQAVNSQKTAGRAAEELQSLLQPRKARRMGAIRAARHAYRTEGLAVFFRGLGVCTVRAFIVNAVTWFVYERTMELLKHNVTQTQAPESIDGK